MAKRTAEVAELASSSSASAAPTVPTWDDLYAAAGDAHSDTLAAFATARQWDQSVLNPRNGWVVGDVMDMIARRVITPHLMATGIVQSDGENVVYTCSLDNADDWRRHRCTKIVHETIGHDAIVDPDTQYVFLIGGRSIDGIVTPHPFVQRYEPRRRTWSFNSDDYDNPTRGISAMTMPNGEALLIGGSQNRRHISPPFAVRFIYPRLLNVAGTVRTTTSPATVSAVSVAPRAQNFTREFCALSPTDASRKAALIFGGICEDNVYHVGASRPAEPDRLDLITHQQEWRDIDHSATHGVKSVLMDSRSVMLVGGNTRISAVMTTVTSSCTRYDDRCKTSTMLQPMSFAREFHALCAIDDHQAMVFGGVSMSTPVFETYDSRADKWIRGYRDGLPVGSAFQHSVVRLML